MKTDLLRKLRKECDRKIIAVKRQDCVYIMLNKAYLGLVYAKNKKNIKERLEVVSRSYILNRVKYMRATDMRFSTTKMSYYPTMRELFNDKNAVSYESNKASE